MEPYFIIFLNHILQHTQILKNLANKNDYIALLSCSKTISIAEIFTQFCYKKQSNDQIPARFIIMLGDVRYFPLGIKRNTINAIIGA